MTFDHWKTTEPDTHDEPPRCACEAPCDCAGPLTPEEIARIELLVRHYLRKMK